MTPESADWKWMNNSAPKFGKTRREIVWEQRDGKNVEKERERVDKSIFSLWLIMRVAIFWQPWSFGGTNKHGFVPLPLSLFLMLRLIFLSFSISLLHLLPVVHLRLMILSSDCGNYPCPAAARHYAQQIHKA